VIKFKFSYTDKNGLFSTLLWEVEDTEMERLIRDLKPIRRILPARGIIHCIGIADRDNKGKPIRLRDPKSLKQALKLSEKFNDFRRY